MAKNDNAQSDDEDEVNMQFDFMMSEILKERKKHTLASLHFNTFGGITFLFSALVTLAQAFMASFGQAGFGDYNMINTAIACLAAFSVFIQSLIKNWNYSGRATLHDSASAALGKIYKNARLKARKKAASVEVEDSGSKSPQDGGDDSNITNLLESLVAQFEQATESCTSLVPAKITSAFDLLDNAIEVSKRKVDDAEAMDKEQQTRVEWEGIYSTLYRELTAVIISKRGWPYRIPDPKKVVKETMENYSKMGTKDDKIFLLDTLLTRNELINKKYEEYEENIHSILNKSESKEASDSLLLDTDAVSSYGAINN